MCIELFIIASFYFFFNFIYLFIYFRLCWVFVSAWGLSLVVASGGHSSSWCAGLSLSRPLLLQSTGSRRAGSVVVANGPSCSVACGIFPDRGSNPCLLHWQADSQPLRHQGSPLFISYTIFKGYNRLVLSLWCLQGLCDIPCFIPDVGNLCLPFCSCQSSHRFLFSFIFSKNQCYCFIVFFSIFFCFKFYWLLLLYLSFPPSDSFVYFVL